MEVDEKEIETVATYDVFRDSYWRYMGYSNEIGEAFRPLIHKTFVNCSYLIAVSYVLGDVYDKASKEHNKGNGIKQIVQKSGDVFLWQMFASVIIPGYTINRITWATSLAAKTLKASTAIRRIGPTAIGLISIPIIIDKIDKFVDFCMDKSYRELLK